MAADHQHHHIMRLKRKVISANKVTSILWVVVFLSVSLNAYFLVSLEMHQAGPNRHDNINNSESLLSRQMSSVMSMTAADKNITVWSQDNHYTPFNVLPNEAQCGMPWTEYYQQLKPPNKNEIFMWTVSGGEEYRKSAELLLKKWKTMEIYPVLLIALDQETAESVCASGYPSVLWDVEKASYSKVADSKFMAGALLADRQHTGFFIELDIFCRENPILHFVNKLQQSDFVVIGHGDVAFLPNIGMWLARPTMASFFRLVTKILRHSLDTDPMYMNHNSRKKKWFDQDVFNDCRQRQFNTANNILLPKQARPSYFMKQDEERRFDLLDVCNMPYNNKDPSSTNTASIPIFDLVGHSIISAHDPPTVYDTTICLHPLMPVPFVPLAYKFAAAKFLGFDAEIRSPNERLLKMFNGDYTSNECYDLSWTPELLDAHERFQEQIKYHITAMAVMAMESNRTLVLPRYLRDKDAWAVPVMAAVDVGTLPGRWRTMTIEEAREEIEYDELEVIEIRKDQKTNRVSSIVDRIVNSPKRVVAIQNICRIPCNEPEELVTNQIQKLRFCVDQANFLKFIPGIGAWNKMCFEDQCKLKPWTCQ